MDADCSDEKTGKDSDVYDKEPPERCFADFGLTSHDFANDGTHDGHGAGRLRAHGCRPECELIPGQEIACEPESYDDPEEHDAEHPRQLPWFLVGAVNEGLEHVEQYREHHEVGTPHVDLSNQPPEGDLLVNEHHAAVRITDTGLVVDHHQNTGHGLKCEEKEGERSECIEDVGVSRNGLAEIVRKNGK